MKKGFTLIELMVVIVIIGVLAALAIPKFLGATERAKLAEWKAIAKEIVVLQNSYKMLHTNYREAETWAKPDGRCTDLGFDHPGGESRFDYWTDATDAKLGGATLLFETGFHQPTEQGWMNTEGNISPDGDFQ